MLALRAEIYILRNNGDNTATCTFLVRDPGPDKVLPSVKDGRGTRSFRYLEKTMSNVFHNEQNAGHYVRIGGESFARNGQGGKAISCDLNRLIMWDRVLTQDELLRVMMKDPTTFRVGTANGVPDNTVFSFDIAPGELPPGWNTIKVKNIGQGVYWCCLDYHHLELIPRPVGTCVLFR
jgi:hypothetical protein